MNVRHLARELGDFVELEDPAKARGFLRVEVPRPLVVNIGEWRLAGAIRGGPGSSSERCMTTTEGMDSGDSVGYSRAISQQEVAHSPRQGQKTWHMIRNR
ncbi:hypothetical protein ACFX12_045666 [Malus domestica]